MIEGKKQFAFNMSDIKNAENYFVLVFCWFSAQKTILLLPENQQKTTRIVFSIFMSAYPKHYDVPYYMKYPTTERERE